MQAKKMAKRTAKKTPAKKTRKAAPKKKAAAKIKKGQAYECHVCGYRVIVDEVCGCSEEHVLICCGEPMR
jgi:rubrerythrin